MKNFLVVAGIVSVGLIALSRGCGGNQTYVPHVITADHERWAIPWQRSDLLGYSYKLLSDTAVWNFHHFFEDGNVPTTIGARDGAVAGPVFFWKIDEVGDLMILEDEEGSATPVGEVKIKRRFSLIRLDEDIAVVWDSTIGRMDIYERKLVHRAGE